MGFLASAANEATPAIVAEFARVRPGWKVRMRQSDWADPTAGLADGLVEVAILRLPLPDTTGLRIRELFSEPRCAVLPAGHRLAGHDRIAAADLREEAFVAAPAHTGTWRDYWLGGQDVGGPPGPPVRVGAVTTEGGRMARRDRQRRRPRPGPGVGLALLPAARPGVPAGRRRSARAPWRWRGRPGGTPIRPSGTSWRAA